MITTHAVVTAFDSQSVGGGIARRRDRSRPISAQAYHRPLALADFEQLFRAQEDKIESMASGSRSERLAISWHTSLIGQNLPRSFTLGSTTLAVQS
jgi:hypothetical protein